ncbi:hypothetical protein ACFL1W_01175 [Candidatus Margulisiibacteriota bacterium]
MPTINLSDYPPPADVLKNEKEALRFLSTNRDIATHYSRFFSDAQNGYKKLDSIKRIQPGSTLLDFESSMDIKVNNNLRRVFVGGLIRLDDNKTYTNISYSMAISEQNSPSKVLRRFHFDYDAGNDDCSRSVKPFYHLQYGGRNTPGMKQEGFDYIHIKHSDPEFSVPRISYFPMSLIFLVYLVLKEFDKEHLEILAKPGWHAQLCKSEKLMLEPFYKTCCKAIDHDKSILMDCYY